MLDAFSDTHSCSFCVAVQSLHQLLLPSLFMLLFLGHFFIPTRRPLLSVGARCSSPRAVPFLAFKMRFVTLRSFVLRSSAICAFSLRAYALLAVSTCPFPFFTFPFKYFVLRTVIYYRILYGVASQLSSVRFLILQLGLCCHTLVLVQFSSFLYGLLQCVRL